MQSILILKRMFLLQKHSCDNHLSRADRLFDEEWERLDDSLAIWSRIHQPQNRERWPENNRSPAHNGASEGQKGQKGDEKEAREKEFECSLTTDVGGFERAAITREGKRAGGYPPLAERFNGGLLGRVNDTRPSEESTRGVGDGGAQWVARGSGALGRKWTNRVLGTRERTRM